ncbi:hypothetical protein COU91_01160 [Candidatus Saccharibacteria bacterium CG10_big_fil_rev_8_21_14_0_10_47_8]|nr:MAG: hypothetical protein COU91_01160 [Candidatus Saccharibacteria bacterium CG10_big_fil_rev_8_21_14_0_10_47_8]
MPVPSKPKQVLTPKKWPSAVWRYVWRVSFFRRVLFCALAVIFAFFVGMYSIGQWYIAKHSSEPLKLGTTFVPDYAKSFGLDPNEVLRAMFEDLGMRQIRLVSYWKNIEVTPSKYDFSQLDSEFALASQYNAQVSLAIGLRQPRWPECHEPKWIDISASEDQWKPQLFKFISAVVDRYKNNPALDSYQLENEYFMSVFGECKNFDRSRLIDEFNLVKQHDSNHKVIIARSNNWIGLPVGKPTPDQFGISVYKRVWDASITHRYFEYPLPAWFYAGLAGGGQIITGKDMIIHELQAEPWTPNGLEITQTSLNEQFKSMNAKRMKDRIAYGEATGMRTIDLWGAEWWYWLKVKKGDPSVWNVVKDAVAQADTQNQKLTN